MTAAHERDFTAGPETKAVIQAESICRMLGNLGDTFRLIPVELSTGIASNLRLMLEQAEKNIPAPQIPEAASDAAAEGEASGYLPYVWGFVSPEQAERMGVQQATTAGQTEAEAV